MKEERERKKKDPPALQRFVNILTGMELQLRGSGQSISSGLSSKKWPGLCFEGLWTCLGDNNSPVDACLASTTLLTLPPTLLAPPHLNHLHRIRLPCIYYSSHPQFTVSLWPLTCCQCDLYFFLNCVNHLKHLWEKKGGICYFRFSNDSGASPLICLGKAIWMTLFPRLLISSWGVYYPSTVLAAYLTRSPTTQTQEEEKKSQNNNKCQSYCYQVAPEPYR